MNTFFLATLRSAQQAVNTTLTYHHLNVLATVQLFTYTSNKYEATLAFIRVIYVKS